MKSKKYHPVGTCPKYNCYGQVDLYLDCHMMLSEEIAFQRLPMTFPCKLLIIWSCCALSFTYKWVGDWCL